MGLMIRVTGLAPWELEFTFPGSLSFTFLAAGSELALGQVDRPGVVGV